MGLRGPKPKPTALKELAGNPGKRPLNTQEADPPRGMPAKPDFVTGDAERIWAIVVQDLFATGLARPMDWAAVGRYCCLMADWIEARTFVEKFGRTMTVRAPLTAQERKAGKKEGRIIARRRHPEAEDLTKLSKDLMHMEDRFGLNPSARSSIRADNPAKAKAAESQVDAQVKRTLTKAEKESARRRELLGLDPIPINRAQGA